MYGRRVSKRGTSCPWAADAPSAPGRYLSLGTPDTTPMTNPSAFEYDEVFFYYLLNGESDGQYLDACCNNG